MDSMSKRSNPYDYINEVTDPDLFAGRRQELAQIGEDVANLSAGHSSAPLIAIAGERRIGKTSASLRVLEICEEYNVFSLRVSLTDLTAAQPWEFWYEVFYGMLSKARSNFDVIEPTMGFQLEREVENPRFTLTEDQLQFFSYYNARNSQVPQSHLVNDGLSSLVNSIVDSGNRGILLVIDEAHLLLNNRILIQQLRSAIREAGKIGVVFVGETELSKLFAEHEQPLFAQGTVIPFKNFSNQADVAECALLPLEEDERQLVSPMTIDYLVKLSQGKPNQIRLICYSIFNRYQKGLQSDLNITIEALDEVLDAIATTYSEYDVQQKVQAIRRLSSVDLEALYNMTRYPDWALNDVVELDESFRAEGKSQAAASRREAMLKDKREYFVGLGLMDEDPNRYILAGDEFLALYLRFWYEIQKHGRLSRSLVLGKGPPTPFGEKIEKLIRFLCWELKRPPSIVITTFGAHDLGNDDPIKVVKARFEALEDLLAGNPIELDEKHVALYEWFRTCELVGRPGRHHLVCLFVRNRDNPRETMGIELYFESIDIPLVVPISTLNSLRQRAEDSRILIEGWDNFSANLSDLNGLLEAIGGPRLEEIMNEFGTLQRWHLAAVQHHVAGGEATEESSDFPEREDSKDAPNQWINLYLEGKFGDAEESVTLNLQNESDRRYRARLFNDRGYIRYGSLNKEDARRDLQTAIDLHFSHLPLTLSNLAVSDLDEGNYEKAISNIQDAMFLTLSAEDVSAGCLRLRLATWQRARKGDWEQHPANVLEASYINLGFAMLQSASLEKAIQAIEEGLALMPSSLRLKHGLARMHLFANRYDLALPIYRDLGQHSVSDPILAQEITSILRSAPRRR